MKKPRRYTTIYRVKGVLRQFDTDDIHVAFGKKSKFVDGEVYEDLRYKAKLRLYGYLLKKQLYL
jgi:hypothetical protein